MEAAWLGLPPEQPSGPRRKMGTHPNGWTSTDYHFTPKPRHLASGSSVSKSSGTTSLLIATKAW